MKRTQFPIETSKKYGIDQLIPNSIIPNSYLIEYSNKEYIQRQDSKIEYIYLILKGKAKIVRITESGKQIILQFISERAFIGELTLVGSESVSKDVVAIGDVLCLAIPYQLAESELMNDNAFLRSIAKFIGDKVLIREKHFTRLQTYEAKYRFAEVVLETSVNEIYSEKQTEIAEYLGISYRHMLYIVQQFKEAGCLTKIPHGYRVNRVKLIAFLKEVN